MEKKLQMEKRKFNSEDLSQDNQKNKNAEAVRIVQGLRYRAQLRRHLANPSVFPQPENLEIPISRFDVR